jgi:hypothetical protein
MVVDTPTVDHPLEVAATPADRSMQAIQYGIAIIAALAAILLAFVH